MRSHRAAEIDFYEELGVEQHATSEQIRNSFRALVRLLHPDQYTDPELKDIAERQMRRINRIYSVLSDVEKRRAYDAAMDDDATPTVVFSPKSNIDPKRFVTRFLWSGAGLILAGACVWLYLDAEPAPPASDRTTTLRAAPAPRKESANYARTIEELRSDLRNARSERDAARYEATKLRAALESRASHAQTAPREMALPAAAAVVPVPIPEVKPPAPAPRASYVPAPPAGPVSTRPLGSDPHQYAGFWFFAPSTERTNKNLYPPQFIEAVLTEHNGVVHGTYRSRYRIVDRAISPDVNFEFTGTPTSVTLATPWTGPGGAKGQITLRLTGENSLKFDWSANDLGSIQGLMSGTATLTRRIE